MVRIYRRRDVVVEELELPEGRHVDGGEGHVPVAEVAGFGYEIESVQEARERSYAGLG